MVGDSGPPALKLRRASEKEKAAERKLTTEDTESTEEENGTEIGPGKCIPKMGRLVIRKLPPHPVCFA
jgi:hypothetical protein